MTVLDSALEFSDAQALASLSSGATTVGTNTVDMRTGLKDTWAASKNPELGGMTWNVNVNVAMVGAGAKIIAKLVTKATASSMSSGFTLLAQMELPALSAAGTKKALTIPPGVESLRYVTTLYTASGAQLTSGTFDAWLGLDNEVYD